jgi:hypothetical protein
LDLQGFYVFIQEEWWYWFTEDFNQVLLARQDWRMIASPNSLCSTVLCVRYLKDGDFMFASCPIRASFTWRSIFHGRDLLKEGLIWKVGDGSRTNVYYHNWIPRATLKHPLGHRPDVDVEKIGELLFPNGAGWDYNKPNELFFLRRMWRI